MVTDLLTNLLGEDLKWAHPPAPWLTLVPVFLSLSTVRLLFIPQKVPMLPFLSHYIVTSL